MGGGIYAAASTPAFSGGADKSSRGSTHDQWQVVRCPLSHYMAPFNFLGLGAGKLFQCARILNAIKHDYLLAQPQEQSIGDCPPDVLPPTIAHFIKDALDLPEDSGQVIWDSLKSDVWGMDRLPMLVADNYMKFKQFGWERGA